MDSCQVTDSQLQQGLIHVMSLLHVTAGSTQHHLKALCNLIG